MIYSIGFSQALKIGVGYGIMNYQGDLQNPIFTTKLSQQAISGYLKYDLTRNIVIRGVLTDGSVYGDDKFNPSPQKERNLNFRSKIYEAQLGAEYHFLGTETHRFSPFVFAGIAAFHFNPYTNDTAGATVFLRFFSTEGEGLPEYPDRKMYSNNQIAIPFGFGFNFRISNRFTVGAEFSERKLFTDYLDDVSKGYIDYNTLLKERGPLATRLAYRGPGPYPPDPSTAYNRGNPANKDWYYTAMITLFYNLFGNNDGHQKTSYGCPKIN
ncbi:MAG: hypothetical protein NVSMB45_11440 [Ginsengibacter sp.]